MKYFIALLAHIFCLIASTEAQTEWRKSKRSAESAERDGKFAEAAAMYEAAWKANNKKTKLIFQAGELYAQARDYQNAAACYKVVKDDKGFPFARLYYARALRQSGAYEKAMLEYALFSTGYGGNGADMLRDYVLKEIRGCEMGMKGSRSVAGSPVQIQRLGATVNSTETDFAPVGFGEDLLYFSSNISGKVSIYRSQKQNGLWTKAVLPTGFPIISNRSICNGSFSPDYSRFYFTECSTEKAEQASCHIYVMSRSADRWSEPQKLPSHVNVSGYTSTHPSVANINGKEFLFFSSNKPGGRGGMDLYSVRIYPDKKEPTVGLPVNLGEQINTEGNEVTPFFDVAEKTIYFSSNAHISMGGLDILKAKWQESISSYGKAENVGMPYNSPADDYYFLKQKNNLTGFLVSNRSFKDKPSTTDDDILEFSILQKNLLVNGKVSDKCKGQLLPESRINLYEIMLNGQQRLLNTKLTKDGTFAFGLLPDKKFRLEAEKKGFRSNFFEISTFRDSIGFNQEKNIELDCDLHLNDAKAKVATAKKDTVIAVKDENAAPKALENASPIVSDNTVKSVARQSNEFVNPSTTAAPSKKKPEAQTAVTEKVVSAEEVLPMSAKAVSGTRALRLAERKAALMAPVNGTTSVGTMPLYETTSKMNEKLVTSAPKHLGTYYKIQIIALKRFDFEEKRYDPIRGLGRVDMEYIVKKDMVRVLLADYFNREDALKLIPEIRKYREFSEAFIVQYIDGVRH